ncbi:MAG: Dps family protein [Paracoccaceae bacterium]
MRLTATVLALTLTAPLPAFAQQAGAVDNLPFDEQSRARTTEALQSTLFELLALRQHVHQMHWNVVGKEFYQLHEFYAELYGSLDEYIDMVGGRMATLGAPTDARPSQVVAGAGLEEPPTGYIEGVPDSIEAVLVNYATVSDRLEARIASFEEDMLTQDLLIGLARAIQKDAWMLRAHVQAPGAD